MYVHIYIYIYTHTHTSGPHVDRGARALQPGARARGRLACFTMCIVVIMVIISICITSIIVFVVVVVNIIIMIMPGMFYETEMYTYPPINTYSI